MSYGSFEEATHLRTDPPRVTFDAVYKTTFAFVFRNAKRLGVDDGAVDDVVQEVFLVVHRRLDDYDGRAPLQAWVFGILSRVVSEYRRAWRRKRAPIQSSGDGTANLPAAAGALEPNRIAEQREAFRLCSRLLDQLDDEKREVFILSELEQMTAPEIAEAIEVNLNTVYSRIRAAKKAFAELYARETSRSAEGRRR
jgi:RNA polymerase sigma-70 factor (ECF subfamily)